MKLKCLALAVALICAAGSDAQAQWGGLGGYGSGFGYGGCGFNTGLYGLGYVPVPPYFAIHPPVYYGQTIHRTYGRSPFVRPGFSHAAPAAAIAPQMVSNPYVDDEQHAILEAAKGERPQLVLNPYVEQPEGLKVPERAGPKPELVINPYFKPAERIAQNK